MATNAVITDGTTGGTNINVVKVIVQTTENNDAVINAAVNRGYITTLGTLQTINMPTPCMPGDVFYLQGKGAGLFHVSQRAGEQIILGSKSTVVGVAGYIESTNANDNMTLICTDSAGLWVACAGYVGTFDIDGTTTNNTINDTAGAGAINFTSTGNNVAITGVSPNYDLNIGGVLTGLDAIAITNAAPVAQGDDSVTIGVRAAETGQVGGNVAIGYSAGRLTQGESSSAIGVLAGEDTQGQFSIAFGTGSGRFTQGLECVAIGNLSGNTSQELNCVAIGFKAGQITQRNNSVAVGHTAGETNQGSSSVSVGGQAGQTSQGAGSIAIGASCGTNNQGANCVSIGLNSGNLNQGSGSVSMGFLAGQNSQGGSSIALGWASGRTNQGPDCVSLGFSSGSEAQGGNSVAIGRSSGRFQQGIDCVSVGRESGEISQGQDSIAIGLKAGQNSQAIRSIAIGCLSANSGQLAGSIAIGHECAQLGIAADAIAFGRNCVGPTVPGRLAFGPNMETLAPVGAVASTQDGWFNMEHKGTPYRVPMFSAASEASIVSGAGQRSYGEIYKEPNINDTQFIGTIWERWESGTFFAGPLSNFVWDDPTNKTRMIYTGPGGVFNLRFNFATEDGSPNDFTGAIYLNGVIIPKSIFWFRNTIETAMTSSGYAKVALATNDYIEPWMLCVFGGVSLTAKTLTLDANEV